MLRLVELITEMEYQKANSSQGVFHKGKEKIL